MMPTTTPLDRWTIGDAYERYMGRWSRQLAPRILQGLEVAARHRWLDVGCGTGALCAAIVERCEPASVIGVDPSEGFLATARARLGDQVAWHRAGADAMPLADASVDCTVSSLVLNFVPDVQAALREMARVTSNGGRVAASVWDYAGTMEMIRAYWDAAAQFGLVGRGQDEGVRFPLCRPEALASAFAAVGLRDVEVVALDMTMHFADFDDYWQPFLGGQGPAPAHAMALDEPTRLQLRDSLRARLPVRGDGSLQLAARAWAASGRVSR